VVVKKIERRVELGGRGEGRRAMFDDTCQARRQEDNGINSSKKTMIASRMDGGIKALHERKTRSDEMKVIMERGGVEDGKEGRGKG